MGRPQSVTETHRTLVVTAVSTTLVLVTFIMAASMRADPSSASAQRNAEHYEDSEAYRVYSAILPRFVGYVDSPGTLVLRAETISYSPKCLHPNPSQRNLVGSAIADYNRLNRSPWTLERQFNLKNPYELVPETDFERRARNADFPGLIELSAVGFNSSKTIAVVYLASYCRAYCFAGNLVVARKEGDQWKEARDPGLFCWWKI